jgi:hypothetical protein
MDPAKSKNRMRRVWVPLIAALSVLCAMPSTASAHGPIAPIASSYLARVASVPAGVRAKVIDGDQRMWLSVPSRMTLVVLDYRGAPYLRFSRIGVAVNQNSTMYYFNQTPPEVPPRGLGPRTAPHWSGVSGGPAYSWHDGRLHALANVAIAPGTRYVGRWTIPVRVNGAPALIAGGLWHADDPSLVWFWPIVVLIACVLAAWRLRRPELDQLSARVLVWPALAATVVAAAARDLRGRPTVSPLQVVALTLVCAFVAWAVRQVGLRRATYFTYFVVGFVALWEGANLIPTLLNGFVLAAVPPFVARAASVVCLGCGVVLVLLAARLVGQPDPDDDYDDNGAGVSESYA